MKTDYLSRLRRAARWMLPPEDADDVVADYSEIASGRSDAELERDLGSPMSVVRQVADGKEYRRWLRVFTVLSVCVLLVPVTLWVNFPVSFLRLGDTLDVRAVFWPAGLLLALCCRWKTRKSPAGTVPKALPSLAAAALLAAAGMILWQRRLLEETVSVEDAALLWGQVRALIACWHVLAFLGAAMGLFALVRARTESRRYLALFVVALTVELIVMSNFLPVTSLSLEPSNIAGLLRSLERNCAVIAAIGVSVAGVCLC